ncbi:MAG: 50S ribosomal protein L23 [Candidatus Kerfeldbacteria bacterium]|nr:50S ribosomal protein L23 [Candidatus Kerfeldbacteria bacterium]
MGIFDLFKKRRAAEQKESIIQKASDSKEIEQKLEPVAKEQNLVKPLGEKKIAKPAAKKVAKAKLLPKTQKKALSLHSQAYRILLRPVVTEKAAHLQASGQYAFEVLRTANKREVAKAVQQAYGVTPTHVTIINTSARARRFGQHSGWTKATKKAIVTLKAGDKIELFESV